ncbi:MAG: hypothetical protein JW991_02525 [Candidatus Pacebacteria bacterium]|nr:hypothetical protein [Candidatus Paceibacterota bacterium]
MAYSPSNRCQHDLNIALAINLTSKVGKKLEEILTFTCLDNNIKVFVSHPNDLMTQVTTKVIVTNYFF